jgi:putative ABC transport system permease protein
MRALRFALVAVTRDWKSGELRVLMLALVVAVAALTAVGFFTNRVGQAVIVQAAEVLAADLRLQSSQPIAYSYDTEAHRRGLRATRAMALVSVVFHGERSVLTSLRPVSAGYPLRGRVRIADEPFATARTTDEIPAPGQVWADARLLATLDAPIGASLSIGAATLKVTRVLDYRPDQGATFVELAPIMLLNMSDVQSKNLL